MNMPSSGMIRYSAQSESAFPKNFNPNNPPPYHTNLQLDPNLTRLYGYLAGSIVQEIENRRRESAPRMYLFNKMAANGYSNQDFFDLFELAIRYSLVLFYVKRESSDWQQIVDRASKDAINMVVAALILTNQDLRGQYQPAPQEMGHLHNIFNYMQQVEQDAQMVMNSIQNQYSTNPTMMMNSPMMGGGMPIGGVNTNEPTVNIPGFGVMPLSVYNQMLQQQRPNMGGMQAGFNPAMGFNQPANVPTGFNPSGMGGGFGMTNTGISPNAARQLVQNPASFQQNTPLNASMQSVGTRFGVSTGDDDDDWHEGGTEFSGGMEMQTQVPNTPFVTGLTQHSPTALTKIVNGKELHEGKPVYRVQSDPDYFYTEYDGSKLFKPSAKCPAIPAPNVRKSKRMYRIHNTTGEFTVVLVGLTEQEKMDIEKHLILVEDEDQRERMRELILASKSEPIEIRPARGKITMQGEIQEGGEASDESAPVQAEVEVNVPSYGHALNVQEKCVGGIEAQHLANKILLVSQSEMPAAVSTVGFDYEILLDRTSESVVSEFIQKASQATSFIKLAQLLKETHDQASLQKVPNRALIDAIVKIDARMVTAMNRRLQCQLGVVASIKDFYNSYNELMAGVETHFGVVAAEALQRDEQSFIQSVIQPASEEIEDLVGKSLDAQTDGGAYSVGSFAVLTQARSITDIEATLQELNINFGENESGVQIEQNEFAVLFDLCTKILAIKLDDKPVFNHVIRTLDGYDIFFTHSLFNPEAVIVQLVK